MWNQTIISLKPRRNVLFPSCRESLLQLRGPLGGAGRSGSTAFAGAGTFPGGSWCRGRQGAASEKGQ